MKKKQAKREVARLKKEAKLAEKEARKSYTSAVSSVHTERVRHSLA